MTPPSTSSLSDQLQDKLDAIAVTISTNTTSTEAKVQVSDDDSSTASNSNSKSSVGGNTKSTRTRTGTNTSTYRDYSRVLPEKHTSGTAVTGSAQNSSTTANKEPTFPAKLHMILSNAENQDIISWLPHGRSWRILQQKAFEERVIPLFFRHGRYSSFARQVNGWGFRRITHGSDYNSYYHELFLRGMPYLCDKMRRLTSKDISNRRSMEEEIAPDFYVLCREHPLPESKSVSSAPSNSNSNGSSLLVPVLAHHQAPIRPSAAPSITSAAPSASAAAQRIAEMELAVLECRRADILKRMRALAAAGNPPTSTPVTRTSGLQSYPGAAPAAAGLFSSLVNMNMNMNTAAQHCFNSPGQSQLQRELLGARFGASNNNSDVAKLLGLSGLGGMPTSLLGNPYGF